MTEPTPEPTAEEKHAALVERCARTYWGAFEAMPGEHLDTTGNLWASPEDYEEDARPIRAVLDLLANEGRLIDPGEIQSSVGAVFQLWQAAKAEVAQLREVGDAVAQTHADLLSQHRQVQRERDAALAERDRVRTLLALAVDCFDQPGPDDAGATGWIETTALQRLRDGVS